MSAYLDRSSSSSSSLQPLINPYSYQQRVTSLDQVGEGTYGYVYRAKDKKTGELVALKRLIFHKEASGFPLCAVREIKFLKSLQHKNIVKLKDVATSKNCEHLEIQVKKDININQNQSQNQNQTLHTTTTISEDIKIDLKDDIGINESKLNENNDDKEKKKINDDKKKDKKSKVSKEKERIEISKRNEGGELPGCGNLYLVFEYVDHDLGGLIDAKVNFPPRAIKCIMKQLLEVLDYLSEKKIIHRDIKSSNILLSNRYHVKLADFGLARSIVGPDGLREGKIDLTNNVITMWYKPPELLLGTQRYSYAVDIWSAGCVLAELELGRPLFPGKSEQQELELICKAVGSPTEENWPGVTSLPNYDSLLKNMQKYTTNFRSSYSTVISDSLIGLLERILVIDPSRRTSARIALSNNYFSTPPLAPHDPAELEPLNIEGGASLHEFQTKQKRKQKEENLSRGDVVADDSNSNHAHQLNPHLPNSMMVNSETYHPYGNKYQQQFIVPPPPPPFTIPPPQYPKGPSSTAYATFIPPHPYIGQPMIIPQQNGGYGKFVDNNNNKNRDNDNRGYDNRDQDKNRSSWKRSRS